MKKSREELNLEHLQRIEQIAVYLRNTPKAEQGSDSAIYTQFGGSVLALGRARYMVEHNTTAAEAVEAVKTKAALRNKSAMRSHENESMMGALSLEWLTHSWRPAQ